MTSTTTPPPVASDKLDSGVLRVAGVVVLGAIMAILDATVVSVALPTFQHEFHATYATVAWTMTGYTLALATVIPLTGWAADRFGTKRLYLTALALFVVGSVLCSLADSAGQLILFRVLQGIGGGMLAPLGMTILTKAAGPTRVGRVMAVMGIPMLLGPISGPILGGWLIQSASWHWIFLINLPIGAIAFTAALRVLAPDQPRPSESFDFVGMLLLSPGLALFLYGVSSIPEEQKVGTPKVLIPALIGLALVGGFIGHARGRQHALIDLGLFRKRNLTIAVVTMTFFTLAFMGSMLLFPSYFLQVRGEGTLDTGLLLAPQGLGAMLTMPIAGRLTDRIGPGKLVLTGIAVILAGMTVFTQIDVSTSYGLLLSALFVLGLGMGMTMTPIMSAAMGSLQQREVARGSTTMNIVQQAAGSVGTAVMSVVLTNRVLGDPAAATYMGVMQGRVPADQVPPDVLAAGVSGLAGSFGFTFTVATLLIVCCLVPAFLLPRKPVASAEPASAPALTH
jgi:drug resistance transporter, EmrB/QacA subfamily